MAFKKNSLQGSSKERNNDRKSLMNVKDEFSGVRFLGVRPCFHFRRFPPMAKICAMRTKMLTASIKMEIELLTGSYFWIPYP